MFAEYTPQQHGQPEPRATVRRARARDAEALANIAAQRGLTDFDTCLQHFADELGADEPTNALWVAELCEVLAGYARVRELDRPADAVANHQPAGWYLGGVVIAPEYRRRGLARLLTQVRLEFLQALGAHEVHYVVNADNLASIDLHDAFGFEEVTRNFHSPGVTFRAGRGILFRKRY